MEKLLYSALALGFGFCTLSTLAQVPANAEAAKVEAATKRKFGGKVVHITGGAAFEFKRNMTGTKSGGALGKLTLPFTWAVEGEYAVTKAPHLPGGPEETIYWKFTSLTDIAAGKTKEQPTFTAAIKR
jgi:hypothetical protein